MDKFELLECTLRDGGYITGWRFKNETIKGMLQGFSDSNFGYIEVGYLNHSAMGNNMTQFNHIEQISDYLPKEKNSVYLAMADVQQFKPTDVTAKSGRSIDGIRVVFYKHQIKEAMELAKCVKENGYLLFMQPMVTIDYSLDEFLCLATQIRKLHPYAVSIVDSFGYMLKSDFQTYFRILDNILPNDISIGFHSHNNMNLALINAQDILDYHTSRPIIIDSSLHGIGRGAGNLHTELIANYYNQLLGTKYDMDRILDLIGKYILPIAETEKWGYSPYYLITALKHVHPNYVTYLLEDHDVSVTEFREFVNFIPDEMYTKCRKDFVEETYRKFSIDRKSEG